MTTSRAGRARTLPGNVTRLFVCISATALTLALASTSAAFASGDSAKQGPTASTASRSLRAADHALAARARTLRDCQRLQPGYCAKDRRALKTAQRRLDSAKLRFARLDRSAKRSSSSDASSSTFKLPPKKSSGPGSSGSSTSGPSTSGSSTSSSSPSDPSPSGSDPQGSKGTSSKSSGSHQESTDRETTRIDEEEAREREDEAAPVVSVAGDTISWAKVGNVTSYVLLREVAGVKSQETTVEGTSVTPSAEAGTTVKYEVRTDVSGSIWSSEVSISYQPVEVLRETPGGLSGNLEIGINSGSAVLWDLPYMEKLGAHTARIEFGIGATVSELAPTVEAYVKAGVKPLLLAGFTGRVPSDAEARNLATWAAAFGPDGSAWKGQAEPAAVTNIEFGNETSYGYQFSASEDTKAGYAARAQAYALAFKEAHTAIQATGVKVGLLAQGDLGNAGAAWVENMFKAVPELGEIAAGWTVHPYGPKWEATINSVLAATSAAGAPSSVPIYVTEWGLSSDNGACLTENYGWNTCMTYSEAATVLGTTLTEMRAKYGSRLGGFYVFQANDQQPAGATNNREGYFGALQLDGEQKGAYTTEVESLLSEYVV